MHHNIYWETILHLRNLPPIDENFVSQSSVYGIVDSRIDSFFHGKYIGETERLTGFGQHIRAIIREFKLNKEFPNWKDSIATYERHAEANNLQYPLYELEKFIKKLHNQNTDPQIHQRCLKFLVDELKSNYLWKKRLDPDEVIAHNQCVDRFIRHIDLQITRELLTWLR